MGGSMVRTLSDALLCYFGSLAAAATLGWLGGAAWAGRRRNRRAEASTVEGAPAGPVTRPLSGD